LRRHSIAPKPAIVRPRRREAAQPADLRHHLLDAKTITLDPQLQMPGQAMVDIGGEQAFVDVVVDPRPTLLFATGPL
jgi:hypothetical protein